MPTLTIEALSKVTGSTWRTVRSRLQAADVRPVDADAKSQHFPAGAAVRAVMCGGERGASATREYERLESLLTDCFAPLLLERAYVVLGSHADELGLDDAATRRAVGMLAIAFLDAANAIVGRDGPDDDGLTIDLPPILAKENNDAV